MSQCTASHGTKPVWFCIQQEGHSGPHRDEEGFRWEQTTLATMGDENLSARPDLYDELVKAGVEFAAAACVAAVAKVEELATRVGELERAEKLVEKHATPRADPMEVNVDLQATAEWLALLTRAEAAEARVKELEEALNQADVVLIGLGVSLAVVRAALDTDTTAGPSYPRTATTDTPQPTYFGTQQATNDLGEGKRSDV